MKRVVIIILSLLLGEYSFAQTMGFMLCENGEISGNTEVLLAEDLKWTYTNITNEVSITEDKALTALVVGGYVMVDAAEWQCSKCGPGDDIEFTVEIVKKGSPLFGFIGHYVGVLPVNSEDVKIELSAPKIDITVTPPAAFCAGTAGQKVTATITNAPADLAAAYEIDWGNSNITTETIGATSTGVIGGGLTSTTANIVAKLKKKTGEEVAVSTPYTVTVNPKPTVSVSPTSPAVCEGKTITLTANGATTYVWKQNAGQVGTSASFTTPPLSVATDYTVTGTSAAGCVSEPVPVHVAVNVAPTVDLTASKTDVCAGAEEITLTATASGGSDYVYTWTGVSGSGSTVKVTPDQTTTYKVKVSSGGCESAEQSVTVTAHSVNVTVAANPNAVAYNGTSVLTATPAFNPAGNSVANYEWTGNIAGTTSGPTLNSVTTNQLTENSTFSVKVTDNMGCVGTGNVSVNVTGSAITVNPSGGGEFCQASLPTTLNAGASGGTGTYTYSWSSTPAGLQLSATNVAKPQILASSTPGVYTVTVQANDGTETKSGTLNVTVKETPVLGEVSAKPASIETGSSVELSVSAVNPSGATVNWSGSPLEASTGLTVSSGVIINGGTYTYKVQADYNGCKSEEKNIQVVVTDAAPGLVVNPPVSMPAGYVDEPIDGSVTVSGGEGNYQYEWECDDPTVTVEDKGNGHFTVTSETPGNKTVCVTVTSGEEQVKECFDVLVTEPGEVVLAMTVDRQCAYPGAELTITITGSGADTYSFILRDQSNKVVMTVTDKAAWSVYKVPVTGAGYYKITDFKYKVGGVEHVGTVPAPVNAVFNPVPNVYATADHSSSIDHCQGEMLTLSGSGDAGLIYTWDKNVQDGVPFVPASTTYTVTGTDPLTGCANTASVTVVVKQAPTVVPPADVEVCEGEMVTLTATGTGATQFLWDNGVVNGQPFRATATTVYTVTAISDAGCSSTGTTTVTVNEKPHIVRTSSPDRRIAIGKDVWFALTAEGSNLVYSWQVRGELSGGNWTDLTAYNPGEQPVIVGNKTDSLSLLSVPKSWDGTEYKCVVTGDCGKDSTIFTLQVSECFPIEVEIEMLDGVLADETPGDGVDGWYCAGQPVAFRANITSEEGYDIDNPHYTWIIDGTEFSEEHKEIQSDTALLLWTPNFTERDFKLKVEVYCDGACENVISSVLTIKARPYQEVAMKILTDKDPSHRYCEGDTVTFWLETQNAGEQPVYTWYNDVFKLPEVEKPGYNEVISYEDTRVQMVLGQADTWLRVELEPSDEICSQKPIIVDTVFMKRGIWMNPSLEIDCSDTLVCKGDSVRLQAIYADAGENPSFRWQRSIGEPFPEWDLGRESHAVAYIDEEDTWIKCTMIPSEDVCYDSETAELVKAVQIKVVQEEPVVTIVCDMENKVQGDELVFEASVENFLGTPEYSWFVNDMQAPDEEPLFISTTLKQGDVVYCMVNGNRICQTNVKSNEIIVNYGSSQRDTMVEIYRNETIKDLDLLLPEDNPAIVLFKIETAARYGMSSVSPDGKFNYIPSVGFVGTDEVHYIILDRRDRTQIGEGYIYITVKDKERFAIPNIITPNGDGVNDVWVLDEEMLREYPNHLIQVFDRNGHLVFEATNYQNDWDGTGRTSTGYVGNINLINGIYTYVIDLGDDKHTILKSWLEIRGNVKRNYYR